MCPLKLRQEKDAFSISLIYATSLSEKENTGILFHDLFRGSEVSNCLSVVRSIR